jgi:hypothetical protein
MNCITLILSLYRNNQNPPEVMTVASSANIMGYDEEFIHRRRPIIYIISIKDPGNPMFYSSPVG